MNQMRLKTTGELVFALNGNDKYTDCLFPYGRVSKKGNRGHTQTVRTSKLEAVRQGYSYGK